MSLAILFVASSLGQEAALRCLLRYRAWRSFYLKCGFKTVTFVAQSTIPQAGRGRFAFRSMPKGAVTRCTVVGSDVLLAFQNVEELEAASPPSAASAKHIAAFGHSGPQSIEWLHNVLLINRVPGYVNHPPACAEPNQVLEWAIQGDQKVRIARASRDIAAGEELFFYYPDFGKIQWYEDYLKTHEETSARQLGCELSAPGR